MKKYILLLLLVGWLTCGSFARGFCLGEETREFPYFYHQPFCTSWGYAGGPITLTIAYLETSDHPFLQHGKTKEERWEAFQVEFPGLSRAYFESGDH